VRAEMTKLGVYWEDWVKQRVSGKRKIKETIG